MSRSIQLSADHSGGIGSAPEAQTYFYMNINKRIGHYLNAVGATLIILFFLSDYAQQVEGWYLLIGAVFLAAGISFTKRGKKKPEPPSRFRMLRGRENSGKNSDCDRDQKDEDRR